MRSRRGESLIELLAVVVIAAVVVALAWPALHRTRRNSYPANESNRIRGIHQAIVTYASTNGGRYPGLSKDSDDPFVHADNIPYWDKGGDAAGSWVGARYAILLDGNYFTPDYLVSRQEQNGEVVPIDLSEEGAVLKEPSANMGKGIGPFNYSYALMEIHDTTSATAALNAAGETEWRDSLNSQAVVAGERNIGSDTVGGPGGHIESFSSKTPGQWTGNVVWNDNHITFEQDATPQVTQYGQNRYADDGTTPIVDHLFTNDDQGKDCKLNIAGGAK